MLTSTHLAILFIFFTTALIGETKDLRRPIKDNVKRAWSGRRDDLDGRLPTDLTPYHYNVELFPYIYFNQPPFSLTGKVSIWFKCVTATDVITINNNALTVDGTSITLIVSEDTPVAAPDPVVSNWVHDQQVQFLHFNLADDLVVDATYVLSMSYTGTMNTAGVGQGLYWDSYVDETGTTKYVAGTQFESIFARQAYPCFDEPDFKATFNATVVYQEGLQAFSNMPVIAVEPRNPGFVAHVHSTTPIMSTYHLCIVVGDYVEVPSGNINGYEVKIWTRPQLKAQAEFAASTAAVVQAWLEEKTNQPYPLPKMDHISLPSKGGAMENWGLITYGEESLVVNPNTSTANSKRNIALIVSHELAHQWYGNLVTCKWWDDTWLNEGFASYYNYYPNEAIGWKPSETQQIDGVIQWLDTDSKNNTAPVRYQVPNVQIAPQAFGSATYTKGGAVLRMISSILTQSTFDLGLQKYLEKMKYKTAVTDDLWASLNEQAAIDEITNPDGSPFDIKSRMDPWLNQIGYPLVTVTRGVVGTAVARRSHFQNPANQIYNNPAEWNFAWDVPITVVTSQSLDWDASPVAWIDIDQTETTLTGLPVGFNDWFMLNPKGRMLYRVHYDDESRRAIVNQLEANPRIIEGQTKASFIDDTFTFAKLGLIPVTEAMATTTFLADEPTYNPWFPAVKHFNYIQRLIPQESWYSSYRAYVLSLSQPVFHGLGWIYYDYETILEQYLRRDMISMSCTFGSLECLDTAIQQYYAARNDTSVNVVDPNNLPTVLCTGIQTFANNWDMWMSEYQNRKTSQVREERYAYLFGLACTNLRANINAFLDALIGQGIAARDKNTAAGYLALNDIGAVLLWDYLDNNWLAPAFSGKFTVLTSIANGFSHQAGLDQLNAFIQRHPPLTDAEATLYSQIVLTVEQNIEWLENNADDLGDWLKQKTRNVNENRLGAPLLISPINHWMHVASNYQNDISNNFEMI